MAEQARVGFISDACTRIGKAIASVFADDGMRLILNMPPDAQCADLKDVMVEGENVLWTRHNLYSSGDVSTLLQEIIARWGSLDVVVHNHHRVKRVSIAACDEVTYQQLMDANVKTAFYLTQILGKYMGDHGSGQIIYASTIHDEKPTGSAFAYSSAKAVLKMLCREAALDLGRRGLRVNLIEMGPVAGDDQIFASEFSDVYLDYETKVPSAQLGEPSDVADLVQYLASDGARYLNGADIRMDGGFVLHYLDHKMKRPVT